MQGLFFGSIGTVVECSELQRRAFNLAFKEHGMDWNWDQTTYRSLLYKTGGKSRIEDFAIKKGYKIDASEIYKTKCTIFNEFLRIQRLEFREGVVESLNYAKKKGLVTAFVSTTLHETIRNILEAQDGILKNLFDRVTSFENNFLPKPSPDAYLRICKDLNISPSEVIAIEDNEAGLMSANSAGTDAVAFLGENSLGHDVSEVKWSAGKNVFPTILQVLNSVKSNAP